MLYSCLLAISEWSYAIFAWIADPWLIIFHQEMMIIWNHPMVQWLMPPGFLSRYWEKQQKTLKWQQKDDKHPDGLKVLPQFGTARNCSCFYPWCVPFGFESSLHHFRVIANFHSVGLEDPICWVGPCPFESPGQRTSPFSTRMDFPWCFSDWFGFRWKKLQCWKDLKKGYNM